MKSTLRFVISKEECIEILRKSTLEKNRINFVGLLKSKSYYGRFYSNNTFVLRYVTGYRASFGFKILGKIEDINIEPYKTKIEIETRTSIIPYAFITLFGLVIYLVWGFWASLVLLFFTFFIKVITEKEERDSIELIIKLIEEEKKEKL